MANTGFQITSTAASVLSANVGWTSVTNVQAKANRATVSLTSGETSELMRCTNFDFGRLASTDTVVAVRVWFFWELTTGSVGDATVSSLQLWNNGSTLGSDFGGSLAIPEAYSTSLFDYTGTMPTYTEATNSGFGAQVEITRVSGSPVISVGYVQMAIAVANTSSVWQSRSRSTIRQG